MKRAERKTKASAVRDGADPIRGLRVAISGGTSGLGLALLREFTARGAHIAFLARNRARVAEVALENEHAHGIVADISEKDEIYPAALQIMGELGGLEVLINNASNLGSIPLALLADTECEDLEKALRTNVLGPFRLTKALLGALSASAREGHRVVVVNISSDAAVTPYARWGAYGVSKAALHQMTRIWNEELAAQGVQFLSLDPGDMDTALHALAVPDADRTALKRPETAAHEVVAAIESALSPSAQLQARELPNKGEWHDSSL